MIAINFAIAVLCWLGSVNETMNSHPAAALAYFGFGLGYVGLTWLYNTTGG